MDEKPQDLINNQKLFKMQHGGKRKNAGRPKGSANASSKHLRALLTNLFEDHQQGITEALETLRADPRDYLNAWIRLLPFIAPKLASVEANDSSEFDRFLMMSADERQARIRELRSELSDEKSDENKRAG